MNNLSLINNEIKFLKDFNNRFDNITQNGINSFDEGFRYGYEKFYILYYERINYLTKLKQELESQQKDL